MKTGTAEYVKNLEQRQHDAFMIERKVLLEAHYHTVLMGERLGQGLMNALRHVAPDLYEILSGTIQFDCFYNDDKLSAALAELGFNESRYRHVMGDLRQFAR